MWQRRSNIDIKKEKELERKSLEKNYFRKAFKGFFYSFFGIFILLVLVAIIKGPGRGSHSFDFDPISLDEYPVYFEFYFYISLVFAVVVMIFLLLWPNVFRKQTTTVICNMCFQLKEMDNELKCSCGGTFENLDLYNWIPEKKEYELME